MAATKFARPGLSSGFASLPVLNTRFAATIGRPRRSLRISVSPLESVAETGVASWSGRAVPGFGCSLPRLVGVDRFDRTCRSRGRGGRRRDLRQRRGLTGHHVHDDAAVLRELITRERLNAGRRDRAITLDVLVEIVGRPEIVVV